MVRQSKIKRIIACVITSAVMICSVGHRVYAEENTGMSGINTVTVNLETADSITRESIVSEIVYAINNGDESIFKKYPTLFDIDCIMSLTSYIRDGHFDSGIITQLVTDCVNVNESSDGDFVILSNCKVRYGDYNKVYLFEFHVDSYGVIYGHNIWQY